MYEGIKATVIGTGRWGLNHVRTAREILQDKFDLVCDAFETNKDKINGISSDIRIIKHPEEIAENPEINAVIVATPAETHFEIARMMLKAKKNVLVEKPITLLIEHAEELIHLARENNVKLMVGHILLYHPAVVKMKELIEKGEIGKLEYIYSNRLNLGRIRQQENILWSFAPHDISVLQYLIGKEPFEVYAHGGKYLQENIEDTTITYLKYPDNIGAHIFVNWLHPFKEQRMVVIGSKGMLVFEDTLPTEKLKLFHKDYKFENGILIKGEEDYEVVPFENQAPLKAEQEHFYQSILNDTEPLTNGEHGLEVLKILEKATERLNEN